MKDDPEVVSGELFVDRLLGYTNLIFGIVLIGVAIYRAATEPDLGANVHTSRIAWLALVALGNVLVTRSTAKAMAFAAAAFGVRCLYDLILLSAAPKDRFASMAFFYSALMLGYCLFRVRSMKRGSQAVGTPNTR